MAAQRWRRSGRRRGGRRRGGRAVVVSFDGRAAAGGRRPTRRAGGAMGL